MVASKTTFGTQAVRCLLAVFEPASVTFAPPACVALESQALQQITFLCWHDIKPITATAKPKYMTTYISRSETDANYSTPGKNLLGTFQL